MYPSRSRRLVRALRLGKIITSSSRSLDYEDLAKSLGVSRRTLFRDLNLLRSAGIESPHARKRRAFCAEPTGELLGRTLTLQEAAAILEFFEHNRVPRPESAYDRALREAKQKVIVALRRECPAIMAELNAVVSTFHNE